MKKKTVEKFKVDEQIHNKDNFVKEKSGITCNSCGNEVQIREGKVHCSTCANR